MRAKCPLYWRHRVLLGIALHLSALLNAQDGYVHSHCQAPDHMLASPASLYSNPAGYPLPIPPLSAPPTGLPLTLLLPG